MSTFRSGQKVSKGYYLALRKFDLKKVLEDNSILSGIDNVNYSKVPGWFLLMITPFLGGLFVLAYPLLFLAGICIAPTYYFIRLIIVFLFGIIKSFKDLMVFIKNFNLKESIGVMRDTLLVELSGEQSHDHDSAIEDASKKKE